MNYGQTIRQAWDTTWRYRFLWLLGLLAGSSAGLSFQGPPAQWRTGSQEWPTFGRSIEREAAALGGWLTANWPIVVAVGAGVVVLGLALLVLSLIAQGGMARATADLAEGHTSSFGLAWRAGLRLVWRYAGLWALLALAAAASAILVAGAAAAIGWAAYAGTAGLTDLATPAAVLGVAMLVALAALLLVLVGDLLGVQRHRLLWTTVAVVTVVPVALALAFFAMAVSVVVLYAQRAIAVEDVGPVEALRSGWRLVREHLGDSVLAWLVALALGLAGGLVVAAGAAVAAAVLGAVGYAVLSAAGMTLATFVYGAGAVVAVLGVLLTLVAVANTFFWNYWTIAYLRLSHQGTAA